MTINDGFDLIRLPFKVSSSIELGQKSNKLTANFSDMAETLILCRSLVQSLEYTQKNNQQKSQMLIY